MPRLMWADKPPNCCDAAPYWQVSDFSENGDALLYRKRYLHSLGVEAHPQKVAVVLARYETQLLDDVGRPPPFPVASVPRSWSCSGDIRQMQSRYPDDSCALFRAYLSPARLE